MTALSRKVLRDVTRQPARSLLVILAIAAGLAAFSTVLSAYAVLTRELNRDFLATHPASATLSCDALDDGTLSAVRASGLVADADLRRVVTGHIKTAPMEWRTLTLFVIRDFSRVTIASFQHEQGASSPAPGELLVERNALPVARAALGDNLTIQLPGQPEQRLRIAGVVHDVGLAQARMENTVYGYISAESLPQLGLLPQLDRLSIIVPGDRSSVQHIRAVAAQVQALLESRGAPVRRVDIPPPGQHPHAGLMALLLLSMCAFGFAILALSSILIVNLLAALMASHVRQMGIMRAIGASRWQIAALYLAQVSLLAVAGLLIGLPAGLLGGRALCHSLATLLNFNVTSDALPPWTWVTGLSAALGVPLAAAAVPLARGTRIPVREALSDFGVDSHSFGSTRLDRILVAVSGPSRLLLLVTRNTLRRRRRFFWTVSALAASGVLFLSALNFRASLVHTLNRAFAATSSDLSVSFDRMYPIDALIHGTRSVPGIARAEAWTLTEASLVTADDQPTALSPGSRAPGQGRTDGRFTVLGLPSATQLIHLEMLAGRPLAPADSDAIVLNSALQSRYPALAIGDTLHLRTGSAVTSWHVIGFCREPFSPALAYVSQRRLNDLSGQAGMANHLRIALHAANAARLATDRAILDRTYEHDAIRVTGSITPADARYGFDQHLLMIYSFLLVTAALVAWIGGLNLVTSTTLNAIERQREIGVLRAIGATTRWIVLLVVAESVFTSLVSWLLAVLLAWPVSKAFGDWLVFALFHTGLDFRFDPLGPPLWLAFSLLLALAAGVPPAIRTARVTIYNALAAT